MNSDQSYPASKFSANGRYATYCNWVFLFAASMKTDLPLCQFVDWCDAAVMGKFTLASY